ncbi:MAG: ATP-binding cassette domain-containing protein [Clostridiales Family XIII bacterium]|jgi:ABC-2 type transport system ATP-binding protein|nr:ATP-binding cassette domain-containing protein [Clostridiales Family XIII bacterium]
MIQATQLVKTFGAVKALDGLSFKVGDGLAYGLLGRNGAGKTTTIRIIMDFFGADSGEVTIGGIPASKSKARIGYLPEERGLYPKRIILEQMIYIGMLRGMPKRDAEARTHMLLEKLEASEYTKRRLDTLSKGNQQKIQLAIALISDPDVVILDEPFSGLDPVNARILKSIVREQVDAGKTVIFSSHQMAQVEEFCDEICLIDHGRGVLEGNLREIKRAYPRDSLYVEAYGAGDLGGLLREKASGAIADIAPSGAGWTVKLTSHEKRRDVLDALHDAGITPDNFSVKEPTLEEIFVDKVGGEPPDADDGADGTDDDGKKKRRRFGLFGKKSGGAGGRNGGAGR